MTESVRRETSEAPAERCEDRPAAKPEKSTWETPRMEDVSEQVMAQPYIRFT